MRGIWKVVRFGNGLGLIIYWTKTCGVIGPLQSWWTRFCVCAPLTSLCNTSRFFYKNTLYKNIQDEIYHIVKNVLRMRSSCIFTLSYFFRNNIALSSWDYYIPFSICYKFYGIHVNCMLLSQIYLFFHSVWSSRFT